VGDAVSNDLNRETLSVANRLVPRLAVAHYTRQFEGLRDPAPIFLPIEFDRQIHPFIVLPSGNSRTKIGLPMDNGEGASWDSTLRQPDSLHITRHMPTCGSLATRRLESPLTSS